MDLHDRQVEHQPSPLALARPDHFHCDAFRLPLAERRLGRLGNLRGHVLAKVYRKSHKRSDDENDEGARPRHGIDRVAFSIEHLVVAFRIEDNAVSAVSPHSAFTLVASEGDLVRGGICIFAKDDM